MFSFPRHEFSQYDYVFWAIGNGINDISNLNNMARAAVQFTRKLQPEKENTA